MKNKNVILIAVLMSMVFVARAQSEVDKKVISVYLELKDALIKSDAISTKNSANVMLSTLKGQNSDLYMNIAIEARKISETTDLDIQREALRPLSDQIYNLVKSKGTEKTLYKQYCPMALGNTGGSWLSAEEQVLNPYFGDMMLKCGSVKETIE